MNLQLGTNYIERLIHDLQLTTPQVEQLRAFTLKPLADSLLTKDDIERLTGYKQPALQCKHLDSEGIPYICGREGTPKVSASVVLSRLRGADPQKRTLNRIDQKVYKAFKITEHGKELIAQSQAEAVNFIFNLDPDGPNKDVMQHLTAHDIYTAITFADSLSFVVDNAAYTVEPYYPTLNEEEALGMLRDAQATMESILINNAVASQGKTN